MRQIMLRKKNKGPRHLTHHNFLKYDKSEINDCLTPYSNNLKIYWEPGLFRPLIKSRKKLPNY